jgi:hypothetical protein
MMMMLMMSHIYIWDDTSGESSEGLKNVAEGVLELLSIISFMYYL